MHTTKVLHAREHKSLTVIAWWNGKGHWALHTRYPKCRMVPSKKRAGICWKARRSLEAHAERVKRIEALLHPKPVYSFGEVALSQPWKCIHDHEGSWTANTGNGYYGGFQMDISFQKEFGLWAYRKWGTANNWPPSVQYQVATGAPLSRWPTYYKYCGGAT